MSEDLTLLSEELKHRQEVLLICEAFFYFLVILVAFIGNSCPVGGLQKFKTSNNSQLFYCIPGNLRHPFAVTMCTVLYGRCFSWPLAIQRWSLSSTRFFRDDPCMCEFADLNTNCYQSILSNGANKTLSTNFYQTENRNDDNTLFWFCLHWAITVFAFGSTLYLPSWKVILLSDDRGFHSKSPRLRLCRRANDYFVCLLCFCFQTNASSSTKCSKSTLVFFNRWGQHYSHGRKSHQDSFCDCNWIFGLLDTDICHRLCWHFPRRSVLSKTGLCFVFSSGKSVWGHKSVCLWSVKQEF